MNHSESNTFVPILTVLVEYGNAPFLWRVNNPDQGGVGPNWCDGSFWDKSFPMSEGLWRKFADWAIEFDQTSFYLEDFDASGWDWMAFHERGLQLTGWLKEEVGDAFHVVYYKPFEDPNHRIDERTEVLAGGTLLPLPPFRNNLREPPRFCEHIVSGGQTGADRGALDFAIEHGYTHGGWAPSGRQAEDGLVPLKYQLDKLADGGYRQRTRRNVEDSDGTLIINIGEMEGGTLATQIFAERMAKPYLVVQLDAGAVTDVAVKVLSWLRQHGVKTLNVAGPRESKRPGIHRLTGELLQAVDAASRSSAASVKALDNAFPSSNKIAYDSNRGFYNSVTGCPVDRAELGVIWRRSAAEHRMAHGAGSTGQAGWRTIARAALFRHLQSTPIDGARQLPERGSLLARAGEDVSRLGSGRGGGETFGADERIFYSRTAGVNTSGQPAITGWDAPVPTGFDDVIYKLQDKNIDLKWVVEAITKSAGKVADSVNAYLKEELFHKRAAKRVEDFGARELKPLMNQMRLASDGVEGSNSS